MPSESDFIGWLQARQRATQFVRVPVGDDLAVLNWPAGDSILVGVDQVLDGVHFDSAKHPPRAIGRKAMNRNLSDCAAMGCLPAAAVVTMAMPIGIGLDYAMELHLGLRDAADPFDCPIVGGDTGSWAGKLAVSVTILGKADGVSPVTRTGARAGDSLYVTGALGGSILGRHLQFSPRVSEGRVLAQSGIVTAMIDLSDGLSRDLPRMVSGAVIDENSLPIHDDARASRDDGRSAVEHALHDGEDYELLFAASAPPPVGTRIGIVTSDNTILLRRLDGILEPLHPLGWEHRL